ncbi:MAG: glycosyltransferase family 2 protein [candidate division Zixibacteria bacterium]
MKPKILLLIPAYNASKYILELMERVSPYFEDDNILIINDGSIDTTQDEIDKLDCHEITFPENRGKGVALKKGFEFAVNNGYDAVITIDSDLQHRPEHLPAFLEAYNNADILIGTRDIHPRLMPFDRLLTNNLTSIIISIFGSTRIRDSQSGYRLIKTPVLKKLCLTSSRYDTESEMLFQSGYLGFTAGEVAIDTVYEGSHSFINPFKDTTRFIRQIWKRIWY